MLIQITHLLTPAQLADCRQALAAADWSHGRGSAGYLSQRVKNNDQLPDNHPLAQRFGTMILDALDANPTFISAALPLKVLPPMFNRYTGGGSYGPHIDGAVRPVPGTGHRVRTDLSATLFLSEPEDYDGGELVIDGGAGVKLRAGDMLLYPGTSVHHVAPVTRGARLAAFFWIQSMVRQTERRRMLFELDSAVQQLGGNPANQDVAVRLAGLYHNLLREWADT